MYSVHLRASDKLLCVSVLLESLPLQLETLHSVASEVSEAVSERGEDDEEDADIEEGRRLIATFCPPFLAALPFFLLGGGCGVGVGVGGGWGFLLFCVLVAPVCFFRSSLLDDDPDEQDKTIRSESSLVNAVTSGYNSFPFIHCGCVVT